MKRLLISTLLILGCIVSRAQFVNNQTVSSASTLYHARGGLIGDGGLIIATFPDTTTANNNYIGYYNGAMIMVNNYIWYRYAGKWNTFSSKGYVDSVLSLKVSYTDTATMLGGYARSGWVVKYTDTALMLSGYGRYGQLVKYTDTSFMLTPYLRAYQGVKYLDTAAMLSGYGRFGWLVKYTDTATEASRHFTTGILQASSFPALTGDITTPIGSVNTTLKNTGTPGTYGSASTVPVLTTDYAGRITSVANTSIQINESQVTNLVSDLANKAPITGGTGYIQNQTGSNLAAQTAKFWITDTIKTNGPIVATYGLFTGTTQLSKYQGTDGTLETYSTWYNQAGDYTHFGTSTNANKYGFVVSNRNFRIYAGVNQLAATFDSLKNVTVGNNLSITTVPALATPATTFLTTNAGVVSSRIPSQVLSDIGGAPASGSGNYIQNQTIQQASSNFNISNAGVIGTTLSVGNYISTNNGSSAGGNGALLMNNTSNLRAALGLKVVDGVNNGSNLFLYQYLDNGTAVPVFDAVRATGAITFGNTVTIGSIPALATAATTFLTTNAGVVSSRTPLQTLNDIGAVPLTGATMTGPLILSGDATTPMGAATKNQLDQAIAGLSWKPQSRAATTTNITLSGTQTVDGVALNVGDTVLVKNQTTQSQNGYYIVAAGAWTRASWGTTGTQIVGSAVYIRPASVANTNGGTQWANSNITAPTIGTDPVTFNIANGPGSYAATNGVTLTGNTFSLDQVFTKGLFSAGTGLSYSNGVYTNTGVTSFSAGTTGLTPSTATTGAVTLAGVLAVANGGTGQTTALTLQNVTTAGNTSNAGIQLTQNGNVASSYGIFVKRNTDTGPLGYLIQATTATGSSNLFSVDAVGNTSIVGTYTGNLANTLTIGTGLSGTSYNNSAAVTITNTGVLSFSGGTTGLTPNTATTGAITLAGTLAIANGGTGATTANGGFNALSPMTTAGDLIYGGTAGAGTRLAAGTATQVLHGGTVPSWSAVSLTSDVTGLLPNANLANPSFFIGTTSITLGRTSAAQVLTGITSIDGLALSETFSTVTNRGNTTNVNLAVGVTGMQSWDANSRAIQIGYGGAIFAQNTNTPSIYLLSNTQYNGTNWVRGPSATDGPSSLVVYNGLGLYRDVAGTVGSTYTPTQIFGVNQSGYINASFPAGVAGNILVNNSGTISTRTAAQLLNDLGAASASGYVPYTGATGTVNLGTQSLIAGYLTLNNSGQVGKAQNTVSTTETYFTFYDSTGDYTHFGESTVNNKYGFAVSNRNFRIYTKVNQLAATFDSLKNITAGADLLLYGSSASFTGDITANNTANRVYTLPDKNGTFAMISDLGSTSAALTMNNSGTGAASGTTFNGSTAQTISYNTIGAPSTTGTNASGTWGISITGNAATVTNGVYTTSSFNLGTTSIPLNRASAAQSLTGVSIDGTAAGETLATVAGRGNTFNGNIGITNAAMSAWNSSFRAIQIGGGGALWSSTGTDVFISDNNYYDGTNYRITNSATVIPTIAILSNGTFRLRIGSTAAVGAISTMTDKFFVDATGTVTTGIWNAGAVTSSGTITANGQLNAAGQINGSSGGVFYETGNLGSSFSLQMVRNTNTSPAGYFLQGVNAGITSTIFYLDVNGNFNTSGTGTFSGVINTGIPGIIFPTALTAAETWQIGTDNGLSPAGFYIYRSGTGGGYKLRIGEDNSVNVYGNFTAGSNSVTGGAASFTTGAFSDAINGQQGRFKGWYTSGSGLALEVGISSGSGNVLAYDRTAASYSPIIVGGSTVQFNYGGGVLGMLLDANGNFNFNFNKILSNNATYRNMSFGGGNIFYRDNIDAYFTSNSFYNSSNLREAKYTTGAGLGEIQLNGNTFAWSTINGSVTAGTGYTPTTVFSVNGAGAGTFSSSVTATNFIKSGGTSTQGMLANGSNITLNYGTYTPTFTAVQNTSGATVSVCQWMQVGSVITVSGVVNPTVTANSQVIFTLSLPATVANFASSAQLSGTGVHSNATTGQVAYQIFSTVGAQTARFSAVVDGTTSESIWFSFTYLQ